MEKQVKKQSGNTSEVFRKLTISSTVFAWFAFVVLAVAAGFLIYAGISKKPDLSVFGSSKGVAGIIVLIVVGLALLCLLASIGISIAQSVLSNKLTTVGGIGWKTIIAVLITLSGITLIALGGVGYMVQLMSGPDVEPTAIAYYVTGGVTGLAALTTVGIAIFNTILCKKTKVAK